MARFEQLEGDLRFVREAVESAHRAPSPGAIYFLWAVVGLVGFALVDVRPTLVPMYWSVAAPTGFAVSAYLGWRHGRRGGQVSASAGWRYALHWGGMLIVIGLAVLMPIRGLMAWEGLNAAILLILALGYFQAGVHLDRPLIGVGVLMAAGYLFVTLVSTYAWTIVGVVLAVALVVAGIRGGRRLDATT